MYKKLTGLTVVWLVFLAGVLIAEDLVWQDISAGNHNLQAVLVNPQNSKIIFAGLPGNILKSDNGGKSWRSVLAIRSGMRNINALVTDITNHNVIYAATDNGLYRSNNSGSRWERIFRGKNNLENQCSAVLNTSAVLLVGTKAGLFVSQDKGRNWNKENGKISNCAILNIDSGFKPKAIIYLAAVSGIFKSLDNGKSWERVYIGYTQQNDLENNEDDPGTLTEFSDIRFVRTDSHDSNVLYFSCAKGVYKSIDQGLSWQKLTGYGLLNRDIKMLCLAPNSQVFGLSQTGVFLYTDQYWTEVSVGLAAGKLNYFALDNQADIYVAAEKGIFKANKNNFIGFSKQALIQNYLKSEPKIRDVQEAAIKYAEVSPEKISLWRKKAAAKAILPQVSVGLDRNSTDLWHWEGGSTTKTDDDILRRGQDTIDWDVSLSWDLSELIWNDDQTSIDVRSKLMVELRDDILDQVNKLYFERLRVKSELDNLALEDRHKMFDKQLRLEELTASLDSLTGGYYSEQLHRLSSIKQS